MASRSGNTTQNLLFTTKYHNKQLETAKQNPNTCDCAIVYGLMVDWSENIKEKMVDENYKIIRC